MDKKTLEDFLNSTPTERKLGMKKEDFFAAFALAGLCAHYGSTIPETMASTAFNYAREMMEARNK